MALYTPDEGLIKKLTLIDGVSPSARLYKNNYTPVAASVLASFTQADFTGYNNLSCAFGTKTINGAGAAQMVSSLLTFTLTGGSAQTIYGYYVTDGGTPSVCMFAERFAASITLTIPGDSIRLQITDTVARA